MPAVHYLHINYSLHSAADRHKCHRNSSALQKQTIICKNMNIFNFIKLAIREFIINRMEEM